MLGRDGLPDTLDDAFGAIETVLVAGDYMASDRNFFGLCRDEKFQTQRSMGQQSLDEFAVEQQLLGGVCGLLVRPGAAGCFEVGDRDGVVGLGE